MMKGGKLFAEYYWAPFNKDYCHRMYSQTKSYTSVAIGLLEEEGKLNLDDPIAKYFPEKPFKVFTCSSWLLDKTLEKYLAPSSNVLNFASLFERVSSKPSNAIIKYVLGWGVTLETLPSVSAVGFPDRIKQAVLNGETFYETLGVIKK
jgi:hypothetical protein